MIPRQLRGVDRRLLMAGAGLVGVLLGLVLLVTVLDGGGGRAAPGPPPRPVPAAVANSSAPETTALVEPAAVLAPRDPFRQLASVPRNPTSGQPAAPGPAQGSSVAAPSATPPADSGATASASLELKSIVKDGSGVARANITVDGKAHSPAQGEVFSYGYRLERIDGNCAEVSAPGAKAQMCAPASRP